MATKIKQIRKEINALHGDVLSIYLNTNPDSEDWKILLKNGLKKTEEYVSASNPQQVKVFNDIRQKVDQTIKDKQASFTNSLICFATENEIQVYFLQISVQNDFQWRKGPATEQLNDLFKKYPNSGVILLQRDKVTLITTALGELLDETHYEFDLETENWKQYKGIAFGYIYASSANHRDKFDRRMKENQARWYKRIAPTIEKYARKYNWKNAHLAGPAQLTRDMKDQLRLQISDETTRNYSGKSAHAILSRTILASK